MSTDLENRLRAAFRAAEQLITVDEQAPELLGVPHAVPRRRTVLWALVAAAALVVAIAALTVGLRPDRSTPPSTSGTSTPPAPTTSHPAPVAQAQPRPKSCDVRLPGPWHALLTAGRVPGSLQLRTMDSTGYAYAVQTVGTTSRLVQIAPDRSAQPIYSAPEGSRVGDVVVADGKAVLTLIYGGNPGSGGGGGQGSATGIVAVTIGARDAVMIRQGSAEDTTIVPPPVLSHGVVYWAADNSSGAGALHAYTLATQHDRVVARRASGGPFTTGGGVYWVTDGKLVTARAGHFPPGYDVTGAEKTYGSLLQSDGVAAFQTTVDANWVLRISLGGARPVTVVRPDDGNALLSPYALSGSLLFYDDGAHLRVLDWTSGAATTLPGASDVAQAVAGGGEVAVQVAQGAITMLRTADLPALRC